MSQPSSFSFPRLLALGASLAVLGVITYMLLSNSFEKVDFDIDTSEEDAAEYS